MSTPLMPTYFLKKSPFLFLFFFLFLHIYASSQVYASSQDHSILSAASPHRTEPCIVVILGASGDLTARKLLPALYRLTQEDQLSPQTAIVGFSRKELTHSSFRTYVEENLNFYLKSEVSFSPIWNDLQNRIFYHSADFEEDQGYETLKKMLTQLDQELGTQGNRIFYLATPPSQFSSVIKKLHAHQLINPSAAHEKWTRVIIEKPFGRDLDSAIKLHEEVGQYLNEEQVYLMDHYLGKEGVQNLFTMRFNHSIFEPLWNHHSIDHIQITMSEDIGIGTRASFWEETGSLRDVFQNHLMQLLAILAMEPPVNADAISIHAEKIKVLNSIRPITLEQIDHCFVFGQYGAGKINDQEVPGYHQEQGVSENSSAETFIAATLWIDNSRWKGVPFYIRTGKRLAKQTAEIVIMFKNSLQDAKSDHKNQLFIQIQPKAGIFIKALSKVPGLKEYYQPVYFGFQPDLYFRSTSPEAYEKLLYDCLRGDHRLYVQPEEQLASWRVLDPILKNLKTQKIESYEAGSWGPAKADDMLKKRGHRWQLMKQ